MIALTLLMKMATTCLTGQLIILEVDLSQSNLRANELVGLLILIIPSIVCASLGSYILYYIDS